MFHSKLQFHFQVRIYIIDHVNGIYEFYRGSTLVYRGKLHNLYVRLRPQSTGAGEVFYDIVLNGFMVRNVEYFTEKYGLSYQV